LDSCENGLSAHVEKRLSLCKNWQWRVVTFEVGIKEEAGYVLSNEDLYSLFYS
jgi:hypothetical protein